MSKWTDGAISISQKIFMILKYIENVRKQPPAARKRFAFFFALGSTTLIMILWGFTLPTRFSSLDINGDDMLGAAGTEELQENLEEGKGTVNQLLEASKAFREGLDTATSTTGYEMNDTFLSATTSVTFSSTTQPVVQEEKPRTILIATTTSAGGDSAPR